ncbi:hypothetical protein RUND412_001474 [Rhizina undulata]
MQIFSFDPQDCEGPCGNSSSSATALNESQREPSSYALYPGKPTNHASHAEAVSTAPRKISGFGGGRRRASISAAANASADGGISTLVKAVEAAKLSADPKIKNGAGGLAKLFAYSEQPSRATSEAGDIASEREREAESPKSGKKKRNKRSKKKGVENADKQQSLLTDALKKELDSRKNEDVAAFDEAQSTPRSSQQNWAFLKRTTTSSTSSSRASSPPRASGLSSLLSAHPGDLVSVVPSSNTSVSDESEQREPIITYEVVLDEDYAARDVSSRPTTSVGGEGARKMCADDFEQLKCLGKGTYGTVLLVRHRETGKLYAQKQLKKASIIVHKEMVEQTKTERMILESVRHPFIVKLYYAFQDHEKLYLILEYAEGGELFLHLALANFFSEDTAAFYLAELVLALSHLHLNVGVVYRDLKPENCLLDADGHLLLTDFGLSKVKTDGAACRSFLGTPEYMAPEVLKGDGQVEYGAEVDWWGVGALAVDLMTGNPPFTGNNKKKITEKILKGKYTLPFYLSAEAKDLIGKFLKLQPNKRLGHNMPKDLETIKKHRFFRKIDWDLLERRELVPPIRPLVTDPALAENFSVDFTLLAISPPVVGFMGSAAREIGGASRGEKEEDNLFGGFSFVASESVLERVVGAW